MAAWPRVPSLWRAERVNARGRQDGARRALHVQCLPEAVYRDGRDDLERSHVPLTKWLQAAFLMCASKKGVSAHQLHRILPVTYKTAWFMCMRLREAMREGKFTPAAWRAKQGCRGRREFRRRQGCQSQELHPAQGSRFALVEREGKVRSHHVPSVNGKTLGPILREQIDKRSYIMTDDAPVYPHDHERVCRAWHRQSFNPRIRARLLLAYQHG